MFRTRVYETAVSAAGTGDLRPLVLGSLRPSSEAWLTFLEGALLGRERVTLIPTPSHWADKDSSDKSRELWAQVLSHLHPTATPSAPSSPRHAPSGQAARGWGWGLTLGTAPFSLARQLYMPRIAHWCASVCCFYSFTNKAKNHS